MYATKDIDIFVDLAATMSFANMPSIQKDLADLISNLSHHLRSLQIVSARDLHGDGVVLSEPQRSAFNNSADAMSVTLHPHAFLPSPYEKHHFLPRWDMQLLAERIQTKQLETQRLLKNPALIRIQITPYEIGLVPLAPARQTREISSQRALRRMDNALQRSDEMMPVGSVDGTSRRQPIADNMPVHAPDALSHESAEATELISCDSIPPDKLKPIPTNERKVAEEIAERQARAEHLRRDHTIQDAEHFFAALIGSVSQHSNWRKIMAALRSQVNKSLESSSKEHWTAKQRASRIRDTAERLRAISKLNAAHTKHDTDLEDRLFYIDLAESKLHHIENKRNKLDPRAAADLHARLHDAVTQYNRIANGGARFHAGEMYEIELTARAIEHAGGFSPGSHDAMLLQLLRESDAEAYGGWYQQKLLSDTSGTLPLDPPNGDNDSLLQEFRSGIRQRRRALLDFYRSANPETYSRLYQESMNLTALLYSLPNWYVENNLRLLQEMAGILDDRSEYGRAIAKDILDPAHEELARRRLHEESQFIESIVTLQREVSTHREERKPGKSRKKSSGASRQFEPQIDRYQLLKLIDPIQSADSADNTSGSDQMHEGSDVHDDLAEADFTGEAHAAGDFSLGKHELRRRQRSDRVAHRDAQIDEGYESEAAERVAREAEARGLFTYDPHALQRIVERGIPKRKIVYVVRHRDPITSGSFRANNPKLLFSRAFIASSKNVQGRDYVVIHRAPDEDGRTYVKTVYTDDRGKAERARRDRQASQTSQPSSAP